MAYLIFRLHLVGQLFFEWQKGGGWDAHMASSKDVGVLYSFFHFAADTFLGQIGVPEVRTCTSGPGGKCVRALKVVGEHRLERV